jgi:ATP/maltotriose-dependent transcriptional regulator MalT
MPESAPARPYGVYLATIALVLAASGKANQARRTAEEARKYGSNIEMYHCSRLADALAAGVSSDNFAAQQHLSRVLIDCARADYLDGIVFAYRLRPTILTLGAQPGPLRSIFRQAVSCGRDYDLARRFDIKTQREAEDERLHTLTAREREVLELLLEGLTNAQIAKRLYITSSTAKVHIRHIFAKLGVRNRLQAVIRAQELLEAGD